MNDPHDDPVREEAIDWLLKVEAAPDDRSLRAGLADWRAQSAAHERAYRSVARMWRVAGSVPSGSMEARIARRTARPRRLSPRRIAAAVAGLGIAACLLLAVAPRALVKLNADHATDTGERRAVALRDGSALFLDAESAVSVDFDSERRAVRLLSGQAYFDVARAAGRPFTVGTDALVVTVRGTGFAVRSEDASLSVTVAEGKVEVTPRAAPGRSVFLGPGDRLRLDRATGAIAMSRVSPKDVASWRDGQLVADGIPFNDLVERIGRYHPGMVLIPDDRLAARRITGVFNLGDPASALRAAADTQSARVTEITPYLLLIRPR